MTTFTDLLFFLLSLWAAFSLGRHVGDRDLRDVCREFHAHGRRDT